MPGEGAPVWVRGQGRAQLAKILIVDDHAVNREFLATVLKHGGFAIVEALDGWSALELARAESPDLIISDILMPSGDGYELVQALRREPALADIPVIFYTAHFNEREALSLARACGVRQVLTKPADPEEVLSVVQGLLAGETDAAAAGAQGEVGERHYMRLVADKLVKTADELEWTTSRLMALIEMCLQISAEREPSQLVKTVCRWTRDLVAARHAVVALWEPGAAATSFVAVSGLSDEAAAAVEAGLTSSIPHPVPLSATGPLRRSGPVGDADDFGLPWAYPPVGAMIVVPVRSPTRQYGWICATSRISGESFTADDERLLNIFASYLGRIFENHCLMSELSDRSRQLEVEMARRSASQWRAEMQGAVTAALDQGTSVAECATAMLKAICTKGGFALGDLWETVDAEDHLAHLATWHRDLPAVEQFVQRTRGLTFLRGHGVPGRVWRAEAPVWIPDVASEQAFLHPDSALAAGLRSAVAFPVYMRGRVSGVICLFADMVRPPDADLMDLFGTIGRQAGQLLERARLEERVRLLGERCTLVRAIAALVGQADSRVGLFERVCRTLMETGIYAQAQICTMDPQGRIQVAAASGPAPGDVSPLVKVAFGTREAAADNAHGLAGLGAGASAAFPVKLQGRVRAVLVLHARAAGYFSTAEIENTTLMTGSIALALDALDASEVY